MFGDVVRELAAVGGDPSGGDGCDGGLHGSGGDAAGSAASVWAAAAVSGWPTEAQVWTGGPFGRSDHRTEAARSLGGGHSVSSGAQLRSRPDSPFGSPTNSLLGSVSGLTADARSGSGVQDGCVGSFQGAQGASAVAGSGVSGGCVGSLRQTADGSMAPGVAPVLRGRRPPSVASAGTDAADGSGSGAVFGCDVDLGTLGHSELKELVITLAAERARAEGRYLAAVGELAARSGAQCAAHILRDRTRLNCTQARSEAHLGERLVAHGFTETLDAMQTGDIGVSHARVIAREAPKPHRRSESDFLELCRTYPSDLIARHPFAYQSRQVEADLAAEAAAAGLSPLDAQLALQRTQRSGSMRRGDDGMWHLRATLDSLTGRHVNIALQAAVRTARHNTNSTGNRSGHDSAGGSASSDSGADTEGTNSSGDAGAGPTRGQLTADAIADLIAGTPPKRRAGTSLIIIADYDLVNDRLSRPRLDDGTPLSARMLAEHALHAKVLPAVFNADWTQLALGRTRHANDAQRLVLAARDGGCVACDAASEHTQPHHITHYQHGGLTEVSNLASLCEPCHHNLHTRHRTITTAPNNKPRPDPPAPHQPQHSQQQQAKPRAPATTPSSPTTPAPCSPATDTPTPHNTHPPPNNQPATPTTPAAATARSTPIHDTETRAAPTTPAPATARSP
ncbi:HNH endonuclease signature motif containing protein [Candidatus Poriferisodalis sp.]|uniref:HNH endonuclease signature motif containing protein n=1 Tax=Candidatus Poriferisodalis sp. TaxID=3101277 RepID=UPI003B014BE6